MPNQSLQTNIIKQAEQARNIKLEPMQAQQLEQYARLVLEWNQKINLISRRNAERTVAGHITDSLAALSLLDEAARYCPSPLNVMDLGPGGGFPGFPLKICRPGIYLTCVEATRKKAKFLELAARELGLQNVKVVPQHSQELVKDTAHLHKYDIVLCRAVAALKELVPAAAFFLKAGGKLLAHKSQKAEQEIKEAGKAMDKNHLRMIFFKEYTIDGKARQIIELEKQKP
ncbi:16S rRNA (guanine(527)-N(7))-methyltransferase RsmG [candidate division TA06 bacterium]|uniref:Ribosomal RNA small subunit methyltransferase G n=1 Tax=candidate division TA06 bacterium TaxID=2250710 RepID=A0A933MLT0_UNCT6|nr:16S rRNA (guanine(527)-N(7))-methyltransferase RsmG [candidate division TA06 bacterium]